jgi:hypothetical protein
VWFILTVIAVVADMVMVGAAVGSYLESHMQDRMVISCLKVQGTDLAYCKNLAAQVKL